ncbi:hypothetical protein FLL45_05335 [Aliikangiella marina]|uniref:Uncharacterized protein n=1 Tax=Aliikangiella marina TaxID=1712262 RepID=A0A545TJG6_9GAMM|nr:CmcI family methyltransferase [Aliikangiella marina]TQV77369.1 hypothetical protein FLL45_05335 [Aliikangiella marina]
MNQEIDLNEIAHLALECKKYFHYSGIDGRTHCFSRLFKKPERTLEVMQAAFGFTEDRILEVMHDVLSDRFISFEQRLSEEMDNDLTLYNFFLSQGYRKGLKWKNVALGKTCYDIGIYQQLIQELQPKTIIELGTGLGGSTLFFYDTCETFQLDCEVYTIDINEAAVDQELFDNKAITFIPGDVIDIEQLLPQSKLQELPHPWLVVDDSHQHIPVVLNHLYPQLAVGDYLIIEDMIFPKEVKQVAEGLESLTDCSLMVDTNYTDMFGRNCTCSPNAIFCKF